MNVVEAALKKFADENAANSGSTIWYSKWDFVPQVQWAPHSCSRSSCIIHFTRRAPTCQKYRHMWRLVMSKEDMQFLAKNHLDKQGKVIPYVKDNEKGVDCVHNLLIRNKSDVRKRVPLNLKRARATVSLESLEKYFNN